MGFEAIAIAPATLQVNLQHKNAAPKPAAGGQGRTIGEQLAVDMSGAESLQDLIRELRCSEATLRELLGYWLPRGPSVQRHRMLGVFAHALGLDATRLRTIFGGASTAANLPGSTLYCAPPSVLDEPRSIPAGYAYAPAAQPTVVWRKPRRVVSPAA